MTSGRSTGARMSTMALRSAASRASTSPSSLRATCRRRSSRIRRVASVPTSAVMSRVSSSSRISASILRPGISSLMSVVSHAGPTFILARRRLKKPRTPGLSASFVMAQSLAEEPGATGRPGGAERRPGLRYHSRRDLPEVPQAGARQAQFLAHHRRRVARPARAFSRFARAAADARSRPRDVVQLAAIFARRQRAVWTCSQVRGRSGSRPCRAAPARWCSSTK